MVCDVNSGPLPFLSHPPTGCRRKRDVNKARIVKCMMLHTELKPPLAGVMHGIDVCVICTSCLCFREDLRAQYHMARRRAITEYPYRAS
jgi:hypothetical protein